MIWLQLTSCCCGCSLKVGTQIIGLINAILSFTVLVSLAYRIFDDHGSGGTHLSLFLIFSLLCANAYLGFSVLLIIAARQEKTKILNIWIIFTYGCMGLVLFFSVQGFILKLFRRNHKEAFSTLMDLMIMEAFYFYSILVVDSYMRKIVENQMLFYRRYDGRASSCTEAGLSEPDLNF